MARITQNDLAWKLLFEILPILEEVEVHGYFDITSSTINTVRQARLMAKIDKYCELPKVFRDNNLSVLAIRNGVYRISRENPFITLPSLLDKKVFPIRRKEGLTTLDIYKNKKIKSESAVLNVAYYNNILDDCFGEHVYLTSNGMQQVTFDYLLGNTAFNVEGVQVDVDGAFEGAKAIHVIEVKTEARTDATIRQLLYPKRVMEAKAEFKKEVTAWLLDYDAEKSLFNFYKFIENGNSYSFDVAQSKRYLLK